MSRKLLILAAVFSAFGSTVCLGQEGSKDAPADKDSATAVSDTKNTLPQVPSIRKQTIALIELRKKFEINPKKVLPREQNVAIVEKLQAYARDENDPASRYAALHEAGMYAALCGDSKFARSVIKQTLASYEMDRLPFIAEVLQATDTIRQSSDERLHWARWAEQIGDEALNEERVYFAREFYRLAAMVSRTVSDKTQYNAQRQKREEANRLMPEYERAQVSLAALESNPEDPAMNERWGAYLCFTRGKWEMGVPFLAKAENELIRTAAQAELNQAAGKPEPHKIAELWSQVAESHNDVAIKGPAIESARYWLRKAVESASDSEKAKLQKQLGRLPEATAQARK